MIFIFSSTLFCSIGCNRWFPPVEADLPDGTIVWAIQQDHVSPDLLFLAAEYGIYFSPNRGENWHMLSAGAPTIAFRDIKLHRRDDDLVGATFGRGFYILDDYSPLRQVDDEMLAAEATLFPVREADWYLQRRTLGGSPKAAQGAAFHPNCLKS